MSPIELLWTKKRKNRNLLLKKQTMLLHRKCAFGQRSHGKSVARWQEDRKALQEIRKILWKIEDQENIRKILWKVKDMVNIPGEFFKPFIKIMVKILEKTTSRRKARIMKNLK